MTCTFFVPSPLVLRDHAKLWVVGCTGMPISRTGQRWGWGMDQDQELPWRVEEAVSQFLLHDSVMPTLSEPSPRIIGDLLWLVLTLVYSRNRTNGFKFQPYHLWKVKVGG